MRAIATLRKLLADRQAATAIEYGLILAMIALGLVGALSALGNESTGLWGHIETKVTGAMSGN